MDVLFSMTWISQCLYLIATIATLVLGGILVHKNLVSEARRSLLLFSLCFILWLGSLYFGFVFLKPETSQISLWFVRLSYGFGTLVLFWIVSFFYHFPRSNFHIPLLWRVIFWMGTGGLFVITIFTSRIYHSTEIIIPQQVGKDILGPWYFLSASYFLLSFGISMWIARMKYHQLRSIEKAKIRIASVGLAVFLTLILLTNVLLPMFGIIILQLESPVFSLAFFVSAFYSMIKYRFLDVKFSLSRALKKIIAFCGAVLAAYLFYLVFRIFISSSFLIYWNPFILAFALIAYFWISRFFDSSTFHRFFGLTNFEYFSSQVERIKQEDEFSHSLPALQKHVSNIFCKSLGIRFAKVIVLEKNSSRTFPNLVRYFETHQDILVKKEQVLLASEEIKNSLLKELKLLQTEVCVPLFRLQTLVGFFILGKKRFDDLYTANEILALSRLVPYLTLRLTALLYNSELQKEVAHKTEELKKKNQELVSSHKKLKKLDQIKDDFLSIASHELRTPMTVIKGYSDFLLSQRFGSLNDQQQDFLKKIFTNAENLILLVSKMLEVSALEAGKIKFEKKTVALKPFLKDIVEEFYLVCKAKNISLKFQCEKSFDPFIITDPEKIKQIMTNLLGNAYKFTPEKGSIAVSLLKINKYVKIDVRDTGIGIPLEEQKNIFKKFQQGKNYLRQAFSGTGLGLNITKGFVEHLGGSIWIESEKGKGTCFSFTLPYKK